MWAVLRGEGLAGELEEDEGPGQRAIRQARVAGERLEWLAAEIEHAKAERHDAVQMLRAATSRPAARRAGG